MNTYVETKLCSISSNTASIKYNGNFLSDVIFDATGFIKHSEEILNLEVSLIHAEIPVSFYNINEYNSYFKFKNDTGAITTISISYGNYTGITLIDAIKKAFNDVNFNITISKITGKYTFT